MVWLALFPALCVGAVVGILGGGGSVLSVPPLVYVAGMDPKQAIAVAHLIVGGLRVVGHADSNMAAARLNGGLSLLCRTGARLARCPGWLDVQQ